MEEMRSHKMLTYLNLFIEQRITPTTLMHGFADGMGCRSIEVKRSFSSTFSENSDVILLTKISSYRFL